MIPINTEQALSWLAARGVEMSRSKLDELRASGKIVFYRAPYGRNRISYDPADLAVLLPEKQECRSNPAAVTVPRSGTRGERISGLKSTNRQESEFQKLRQRVRSKPPGASVVPLKRKLKAK